LNYCFPEEIYFSIEEITVRTEYSSPTAKATSLRLMGNNFLCMLVGVVFDAITVYFGVYLIIAKSSLEYLKNVSHAEHSRLTLHLFFYF